MPGRVRRALRRFFRRVGRFFRRFFEGLWDLVTTVVNAVVEVLESILGWVLDALAYVLDLLFAIPILGRLLRWLWSLILTIVWFVLSLVDFLFSLVGITPEKKLRVCTILLKDETGTPVAAPAAIVAELNTAIRTYASEANVRIIPSRPFEFDSGFAARESASVSWIRINPRPSDADVLDVTCGFGPYGRVDLGVAGSKFQLMMSNICVYGNFRRLVGYGAPVAIFVIRSIEPSGRLGCSAGPVSDYVTIEGSNPTCLAHELGHACNLWHHRCHSNNLMYPDCGGTQLRRWQVALLRASRHVTYF